MPEFKRCRTSEDRVIESSLSLRWFADIVSFLFFRTITWELPPHVHFDALVQLVEMFTSLWEEPSLDCFDNVVANSIIFENTLLSTHFGQYTKLLDFVK